MKFCSTVALGAPTYTPLSAFGTGALAEGSWPM